MTPETAVPAAAPPKMTLVVQANASVAVPCGAERLMSTELADMNGAIVEPQTNIVTDSAMMPGAKTGIVLAIATAPTRTGNCLVIGLLRGSAP